MAFKDRSPAQPAAGPASASRRRLLQGLFFTAVTPAAFTAFQSTPAEAAAPRIEFRIVRAGFILGASSGSGTLRYSGKRYRLRVSGVSLGATFGAASAEFVGRVRNLRKPQDIQGNYTAVGAGLAAAGGGSVARLRNSRGVELEVSGKQVGLMASIDLSGLRIRLA
jgi:lipid-binding SYLF domain-containing protein